MNKQEIIDDIMDFLDFEKIHKVMRFLNWEWHISDSISVPEIYEIRKFLRNLINQLIDENLRVIECGGFRVSKIDFEDESVIKVDFIIETLETNLD